MTDQDHISKVLEWQLSHEQKDEDREIRQNERIDELQRVVGKLPCKEDIKEIVDNAMMEIFKGKGVLAKNTIITTAIVITSITAIVFGIKTMLAWIGIAVTKQ